MGRKLIDDINKYTSSNSILVHSATKGLIRLYCPFTVTVIESVDSFMVWEEVEVVNVKVSKELKLIYIIGNKGYYHYHFSIQV
ncbi:hypothetical protein LQ318_07185 [Aliifodinibius salicampi]|uniref:Uncharacterized protein n=1 Tax=Fodinibius salicampi TaxID=1920655 RepID=A0ABT3PXU9_9BACT|nr:hypothetical protein [Fodinibius salicampi]MCW9712684.1 hypothetical protein [Fodinibius salicampi]